MLNGLWGFRITDTERMVQDGRDSRMWIFCLLLRTWLVLICILSHMLTESCIGKLYITDVTTQLSNKLSGTKLTSGPTL
jgi:hypothetical protein